jgi:hypothetical protein
VTPIDYDSAGDFSEGLAWVVRNTGCGYINRDGRVVIPFRFTACGGLFEWSGAGVCGRAADGIHRSAGGTAS